MAIIHTEHWLKQLYETNMENRMEAIPPFTTLMNHFSDWTKEEWLYFLLSQGMLPLKEASKNSWLTWQKARPEKGLSETYRQLQKTFQGPETDIFLFPINLFDDRLLNIMKGKTGISFPSFILLFFHKDVSLKEKQALLLHEYHHVSRLSHMNNNEDTVTLLESMLMEGMAEWEVKRHLGNRFISKWMKLYSDEILLDWWKSKVKGRKNVKGRQYHIPYIYGGRLGFPRWLGYGIGYRMIESYMENQKKNLKPIDLLKTPSRVIYENSLFYSPEG